LKAIGGTIKDMQPPKRIVGLKKAKQSKQEADGWSDFDPFRVKSKS
jgi:hypothetical protein